jgi:hypothetical protein
MGQKIGGSRLAGSVYNVGFSATVSCNFCTQVD